MGVENSNQQQFGTNEAMELLLKVKPKMQKSERNMWRNRGSDAILAEISRLEAEKAVASTPRAIEKEDVEPPAKGKK